MQFPRQFGMAWQSFAALLPGKRVCVCRRWRLSYVRQAIFPEEEIFGHAIRPVIHHFVGLDAECAVGKSWRQGVRGFSEKINHSLLNTELPCVGVLCGHQIPIACARPPRAGDYRRGFLPPAQTRPMAAHYSMLEACPLVLWSLSLNLVLLR